ncbi:MAG: hypothetical protein ACM37W_02260 [Actinomycetota bacterium]
MKLTDLTTNWSFECLTDAGGKPPPGGLVLQQITHDGHNFAKDIRFIGFWIQTEQVDPSGRAISTAKKFYLLDSSNFTVSQIAEHKPSPTLNPSYSSAFDYLKQTDAALDFTEYFKPGGTYVGYGVSAKFEAPSLLSSFPNCEYAGLTIEQIFLFSRYSNSPKHEPSGGLSGARFHPMIRYTFSKNASYDDKKVLTRVSSIRFDYRLHLFLDRHEDVATNKTLQQIGNQAGLFADSDTALGTIGTTIGSNIWNIRQKNSGATAFSSGAFDAVEKPLVLEVTTAGLAYGFSKFSVPATSGPPITVRCWDNLHWWGSRGPGAPIISAPGAFHCAHMHWRWGGAAKAAFVSSDPRFNPRTWPAGMPVHPAINGMWGPLLDPGIWIQSIRVAVVKNDPSLDPQAGIAASALSKEDWKMLFNPSLRATPLDISAGADIVLWYSTEVHRTVTVPTSSVNALPPGFVTPLPPTYTTAPSGTVFIHGLFFAHDAEKTGMKVGSTNPAYWPTDEATIRNTPQWFRSAN